MKRCPQCGETRPPEGFYRQGRGLMAICKECHKAAVRANYAQNREHYSAYEQRRYKRPERRAYMAESTKAHRAEHPDRYRARTAVGNAVRDGRLVRGPCEVCGTTVDVEGHHPDYSRPLDVRWLCFPCHREEEHGQEVTVQVKRRRVEATAP